MNIFAAEEASNWLLKNASHPWSLHSSGTSYEVELWSETEAVDLYHSLRNNGNFVVEVFGGLNPRVY